jgi:predicted site-specific integrase-resolvase
MAEKTYKVRDVAERFGVAASTVRGWLMRGLLPGALMKQTEVGSYWSIPESTLKNFVPPKPGPVPKASKKGSKR